MSSQLDGAAVESVAELAKGAAGNHDPVKIDGVPYTEQKNALQRVRKLIPTPDALKVTTLASLVEFVRQKDLGGGGTPPDQLLHVVSPTEVRLISTLTGSEFQRHVYAVASPVLPDGLDKTYSPELLIIALQSRCVESEARDALIALASDVTAGSELKVADDGMTQQLSAKSGLTLMRAQGIKNPVHLAPYRTFPEVNQPESAYVVRARKTSNDAEPISFTLYEADGGAWRIDAVERIAAWLAGQSVPIPILA